MGIKKKVIDKTFIVDTIKLSIMRAVFYYTIGKIYKFYSKKRSQKMLNNIRNQNVEGRYRETITIEMKYEIIVL